jgi:hypothetical protein
LALTPAVGGDRSIPAPDAIARDYLLLALRLDQRSPGLVDGYFGPADLKAQVDIEQLRSPARLVADAAALRARLPAEVADEQRRRWLDAQLDALETQAAALAGRELPYLDHVERCFDMRPARRSDETFLAMGSRLRDLIPGDGLLHDRLAALDESLSIAPDRLPALADWLVEGFRERGRRLFGLPEGEHLRVSLVRNQPWSGYNWYDGGLRSRVDLNVDLPVRAPDLIHVLAHETYPGHHLEHAWKEADLVLRQGRLEASILLINTPECLISEGLADLGHRFAVGPDGDAPLLAKLADRAGLAAAGARTADRLAWAERQTEIAGLRRALGETAVNAALMRHVDGVPPEEVVGYLIDVGLVAPARAEKRLSFIEHPLWRTYGFAYTEGEQLLRQWLEAAPTSEQAPRFARLLHEQLTPGALRDEVAQAGGAARSWTKTERSSSGPS